MGQDPALAALVPALLDRLPAVLDAVRTALSPQWPDYAAFLATNSEEVGAAATHAVERLVTLAGTGPPSPDAEEEVAARLLFEEIGRMQWRDGHDLTDLLAAYHTGARVFWHSVSEIAVDARVPPSELAALAEGVFLFVDQLASSSARGYVLEQSESAATRERMRDELVELLLSDRASAATVAAAAARAGWEVPDEVTIVLVPPDDPIAQSLLTRLDAPRLTVRTPRLTGAIVSRPSAPGRRRMLATTLRGAGAVVGVPVPPDRLPASAHIAEIAARLRRTGVLTDDPVFTDEHLDAIIVHRDSRLLEAFRAQMLRPLQDSTPASRDRLWETLAAWLRHMGDRQAMAADLHIHPQTVRYRVAKLQELYGRDLEDPEVRARLVLALAWSSGPGGAADAGDAPDRRRKGAPPDRPGPESSAGGR